MKKQKTLSATGEVTKLSNEDDSIQVTICPGYTEMDGPGLEESEYCICRWKLVTH